MHSWCMILEMLIIYISCTRACMQHTVLNTANFFGIFLGFTIFCKRCGTQIRSDTFSFQVAELHRIFCSLHTASHIQISIYTCQQKALKHIYTVKVSDQDLAATHIAVCELFVKQKWPWLILSSLAQRLHQPLHRPHPPPPSTCTTLCCRYPASGLGNIHRVFVLLLI